MITHERWQRIKEIFESAQGKTPAERLEFLDEVCGDDEDIREEVEALLTADDSNADFLSAPAYEFAAGMLSDEEPGVSEFANGHKVGRYTILCPLGAGGMGQIYLAQDEQLGRKVALKMITRAFATDPRRVLRFQQEARAASALNHPNVCVIHETGVTDNDRHFIAMEYIQGITLRDKLAREHITPLQALHIARQVADALGAAHAAGIVHRDIKPENIMLRPDGYVKVLDFGLAKLAELLHQPESERRVDGVRRSQVSTTFTTEAGTLMGTVKYMSPEQLKEMELDERTDIWSLGVVLYEMLTRTTPFEARTPNGTIGLIAGPQPPALALPDQLPPLFRNIVQKAMNKDRDDRYQTVTRLAADLTQLQKELERDAPNGVMVPGPARLDWYPIGDQKTRTLTTGSAFSRFASQAIHTADLLFHEMRLPSLFAGMTVVLVLLMFLPDLIKKVMDPTVAVPQLQIQMKPLTNSGTSICSAISADGKLVAHAEEQDGKQRLVVTSNVTLGSSVVVPLEEVKYLGLTFSPDNNYLYFTRTEKNKDGILYRLALAGALPVKLREDVDSPITLSPQGDRFAFVRLNSATRQYSVIVSDIAATEERTLATRTYSNEFSLYGLAWSPDGSFIVCPAGGWNIGFKVDLIAIDVNTGKQRLIGNRSWGSVYQVAWQQDGSSLIISARERTMSPHQLWRITYPAGEVERLTKDLSDYRGVSLSGQNIVTVKTDWTWRMWRSTLDGSSAPAAIMSGTGLTYGMSWTADGKIVYSAMARDWLNLSRIDADGSNQVQLTVNAGDNYSPSVSADGKYIVFASTRGGGFDIYRLNTETGNDIKKLTHTDGNAYPAISGDNRWVAYDHVTESGRAVWKVPLEGGQSVTVGERYRMPVFSPDSQLIVARAEYNLGDQDVAIFAAEGGAPMKRLAIPITEWQRVYWLDTHTVSFILDVGGISNIWSYDIDTHAKNQLTNFNSDQIFAYAWSPDHKQLVAQRGAKLRNVAIITIEPTKIGSEQ